MKNILSLLFLLCVASSLFAQKSAVRGKVFDRATGEPIGFANVQLDGTTTGATTDLEGFFSITGIAVGTYTLKVSYLGYITHTESLSITAGNIEYLNINLSENTEQLQEVVISGKKEAAKTEVQVSKLTVTPREIRALPSAGGQSDIAQYLTVLPGVIFTGDQGGQLYIRGGSPVQNMILLDGMTIYNPFHSIGFFSVFETELIRNVDVYTGGFGAEYGNRISAVVDVKTREGNKKRLAGTVSASPFQAKAVVEFPIIPVKEDGGASLSVLLTGKKALISEVGKSLYPYVNDSVGIPFDYTDFYGKISLLGGNGSGFNFFGFRYADAVQFPIADFSWNSAGAGMDFNLIPANSNTVIDGTFAFSNYDSKINQADNRPRSSGISGLFGQINFTNFGPKSEVKYGMVVNGFSTKFEFTNFKDIPTTQDENTTELGAYLKYRQNIGGFVLDPSIRVQHYASLRTTSFEPRLGIKYNISDRLRFKAAGGLYSQNLLSTINERDVVNLFVGFLSGPSDERIFKPGTTDIPTSHRLQKSQHAVAGFEYDLRPNWDLNLEGYLKNFPQLIGINRNRLTNAEPKYVTETGKAYGVDISTKWEGKRAYFWGTYSLGFVTRNDGQQEYPPVFDRRHNMNLLGTYQLGPKKEWEAAVRWNLGSGFPFTQTQGFYTQFQFDQGTNTDIYGGNIGLGNEPGIIFAEERGGGRLPYYHRMDVSLKRTFEFSKYTKLEVIASATNVYDRPNIFYFDRIRYDRVNQLPILPSLSATFAF